MSKSVQDQKDLPADRANAFEPAARVDMSELMIPLVAGGPFKWHGPVSRLAMRVRLVPDLMESLQISRAEAIEQFREYSDAVLLQVVNSVAVSKGVAFPAEIGDGVLFQKFLDFITEHWDDILRLFLMIIGMGAAAVVAAFAKRAASRASSGGPDAKPKHPIPESDPKPADKPKH